MSNPHNWSSWKGGGGGNFGSTMFGWNFGTHVSLLRYRDGVISRVLFQHMDLYCHARTLSTHHNGITAEGVDLQQDVPSFMGIGQAND